MAMKKVPAVEVGSIVRAKDLDYLLKERGIYKEAEDGFLPYFIMGTPNWINRSDMWREDGSGREFVVTKVAGMKKQFKIGMISPGGYDWKFDVRDFDVVDPLEQKSVSDEDFAALF